MKNFGLDHVMRMYLKGLSSENPHATAEVRQSVRTNCYTCGNKQELGILEQRFSILGAQYLLDAWCLLLSIITYLYVLLILYLHTILVIIPSDRSDSLLYHRHFLFLGFLVKRTCCQ